MTRYITEIEGISPYIINQPIAEEIADKSKLRLAGEKLLEHQFEVKQYRTEKGELYMPYEHIHGSAMEAGKHFKVKGGGGKANYSKIVGYAVRVEPLEILHKITKLEKFIRLVRIPPKTGSRNLMCRPMLREWKVEFQLEVDDVEIPKEVLKDILDRAGKCVGVGDWRPQMKGPYGRFIVTKFKEVK